MCVNKSDSDNIIRIGYEKHEGCSGAQIQVLEVLENGYFKCKCMECGYEFVDG